MKLSDVIVRFIAASQSRVQPGKPDVRFSKAGSINNVELNIMNLRRGVQGASMQLQWEKIGAWRSWDTDNHGLDIQVHSSRIHQYFNLASHSLVILIFMQFYWFQQF